MNPHAPYDDDAIVISFASAVLVENEVPKGMVFRFVTTSKKEFVVHIWTKLLVDQVDIFSAFQNKRVRTLTGGEVDDYLTYLEICLSAFHSFSPMIKPSDFDCLVSSVATGFSYGEWADGVAITVTYFDGSSRLFILNDELVFKMLEQTKRFLDMAGVPHTSFTAHGNSIQ